MKWKEPDYTREIETFQDQTVFEDVYITGNLHYTEKIDVKTSAETETVPVAKYGQIDATNVPNTNITTDYTSIQPDYYKWVLPSSGVYLLKGSHRMRMWSGATGYIKSRLYNSTDGEIIEHPTTERMCWENQGTGSGESFNVQIHLEWLYVAPKDREYPLTINQQWQVVGDSSANSSLQSDSNGWNRNFWVRIADD